MSEIQKKFEEFNQKIKLDLEDHSDLIDKRTKIYNKIKEGIQKRDDNLKVPDYFNLGSYSIGTGIQPLSGNDYDIDVGLVFDIDRDTYSDPTELKSIIYDIIEKHTSDVKFKTPCITVNYPSEKYHVDLVCYAKEGDSYFLAKGKKNANAENKFWEEAAPKQLLDIIKTNYSDLDERAQFRRIVRYLKRWKDIKFNGGNDAPPGIGITLAAISFFSPYKTTSWKGVEFDDLKALILFIDNMLNNFKYTSDGDDEGYRLYVYLPVAPNTDVFCKMTQKHMDNFKSRLESLKTDLESVLREEDPSEATKKLQKIFGDEFPFIEKKQTAVKTFAAGLGTSGDSGCH